LLGLTPGVCLVDPTPVVGSILGTVIDQRTMQPLPDVVVTATAPGLQGNQTVVTDAQGNYRFPQLPADTYTLQFELDGFQTSSLGDIELRAGRTRQIDAELRPDGVA